MDPNAIASNAWCIHFDVHAFTKVCCNITVEMTWVQFMVYTLIKLDFSHSKVTVYLQPIREENDRCSRLLSLLDFLSVVHDLLFYFEYIDLHSVQEKNAI